MMVTERPTTYQQFTTWLLSSIVVLCFAAIIVAVAGMMVDGDFADLPETIKISSILVGGSFIFAVMAVVGLSRISVWDVTSQILPVWLTLTLFMGFILIVFRLDYSVVFFGIAWPAGLILLIIMGRVLSRSPNLVVGVFSGVEPEKIAAREVIILERKSLPPEKLDLVIVTSEEMKDPRYGLILSQLAGRKVPILPEQTYHEQQTGRVDHRHVDASELLQLRPYRRYMLVKRMVDIVIACLGLILFSPIMILVAMLIKTTSPGPIIFTQLRVGESGREFTMYKFRSMIEDAEESGAKFSTEVDDPRITSIGRFIRKPRIDELPQLFNVLNGTMSMIGPRPEMKAFFDDLEKEIPLYPLRHAVRPGITGWAQVMQGYAREVSSIDIKLSYDLFYIKNLSLMMDMVIFFKTIKTIITGFGAR